VQSTLQSSAFISLAAPIMQVRDITASSYLGGGQVYVLDLTHVGTAPATPLKLPSGAPISIPNTSLQFVAVF
jgi:hypothetical protein